MAKYLSLIIAISISLLLSGCEKKENAMIKIVDVEKVISKSSFLSQENNHLRKVKETLLAGKQSAENSYLKMAEEDVKKTALADKLLLERTWGQEQKNARIATLDAVYKAVEQYRVENKVTLVTHKTAIIAMDNSADISDEIIERLKDQQVKYAALPTISTRDVSAKPAESVPAEVQTQE